MRNAILPKLLLVLSLLPTLLISMMWVRGYHGTEELTWRNPAGHAILRSVIGHACLDFYISSRAGNSAEASGVDYDSSGPSQSFNRQILLCTSRGDVHYHWKLGESYVHFTHNARLGFLRGSTSLPYWALTLAAGMPAAMIVYAKARRGQQS